MKRLMIAAGLCAAFCAGAMPTKEALETARPRVAEMSADGKRDRNQFHRMGVRAFAKLRLTHARLYRWHEKQSAFATAIRQAIAIDPQDRETGMFYVALLKENKLDAAREEFLAYLKQIGVNTDDRR